MIIKSQFHTGESFMKNITRVLLLFSFGFSVCFAQVDDLSVVRSILTMNGDLAWSVDEIATLNEGRVVALNLNNKDVGKAAITKLPPEIGQLTELKELSLNDNDLMALPKEFFNLAKLTRLEIQNNSLMSLTGDIARLSQLVELDLRNNQLRKIPAEIGKLKKLYKLQLWGNNFTALPPEIGNCIGLRELYLKGNRLTNLPVNITRLKLKYLDVLDNKLCGLTGKIDKWLKKFDNKYTSLQKCLGDKRFQ